MNMENIQKDIEYATLPKKVFGSQNFFFFLTREARNSKLSVKRPLILKGAQTLT